MLKCGMYETDITPPLGLFIPGYFHERLASGIKDRLYAKAIVVDNGSKVLAIIAIDSIVLKNEVVADVRKRVSKFTGIQTENIMVSATHTHTGGPVAHLPEGAFDGGYLRSLAERAADAAIMAFNTRTSARVGFETGIEQDIAFNRRYLMKDGNVETNPGFKNPGVIQPAGPIDPDVTVIRIDRADGKPMGVVTSYACHLDTIGGTEYSADYPGELSKVLKKVLGQDVVSLFLTGPCGNINHIDVNSEEAASISQGHYKKMGRILAGEVLKVREKIVLRDDLQLQAGCSWATAGVRKPSKDEAKKAEEFLKATPKIKLDYWDDEQVEVYFAEQILSVYNNPEQQVEMEIQAMRLGDMAISAMPGELFVEFGLDIKKHSPARYTIVNTLANGLHGYIPTREAFEQGGYEVRISGATKLEPETGYRITDCAIKLLEEIYSI